MDETLVKEVRTDTITGTPQTTVKKVATVTTAAAPVAPVGEIHQVAPANTYEGFRINQFIYFIVGLLEVLLLFRFIFRLAGANAGSGFVNLVYALSRPFVAPFFYAFGDPVIDRASVFELSTIIAMIVYALIALMLERLINLMTTKAVVTG